MKFAFDIIQFVIRDIYILFVTQLFSSLGVLLALFKKSKYMNFSSLRRLFWFITVNPPDYHLTQQ